MNDILFFFIIFYTSYWRRKYENSKKITYNKYDINKTGKSYCKFFPLEGIFGCQKDDEMAKNIWKIFLFALFFRVQFDIILYLCF